MTAKKDYSTVFFILGVLVFYTAWMLVQPYAAPPDENMRYDIPMYIYKYGVLPRGDDPALINNAWGLSYAFFPILSYMISAIFMKVAAVFSTEPVVLLMAARSVSLLCGVGTAFMSLKIGRKLFGEKVGLLFAVMVAFLRLSFCTTVAPITVSPWLSMTIPLTRSCANAGMEKTIISKARTDVFDDILLMARLIIAFSLFVIWDLVNNI